MPAEFPRRLRRCRGVFFFFEGRKSPTPSSSPRTIPEGPDDVSDLRGVHRELRRCPRRRCLVIVVVAFQADFHRGAVADQARGGRRLEEDPVRSGRRTTVVGGDHRPRRHLHGTRVAEGSGRRRELRDDPSAGVLVAVPLLREVDPRLRRTVGQVLAPGVESELGAGLPDAPPEGIVALNDRHQGLGGGGGAGGPVLPGFGHHVDAHRVGFPAVPAGFGTAGTRQNPHGPIRDQHQGLGKIRQEFREPPGPPPRPRDQVDQQPEHVVPQIGGGSHGGRGGSSDRELGRDGRCLGKGPGEDLLGPHAVPGAGVVLPPGSLYGVVLTEEKVDGAQQPPR
mmetsp:Transcript_1618/g.4130  ORF Transcript_1618/g.4130 Transcript_1618/m.4130 type:complete len:337 (+) Transcript_1618:228-1238(+)